MIEQIYLSNSQSIITDTDFQKHWKTNKDNTPCDQVINAYVAGKNIAEKKLIESFQEYQKKELESFVDSATNQMKNFYDLIERTKTFEIKMRILSDKEIEFLFIIEEEYFNSKYSELYNSARSLEDNYFEEEDREISFRLLSVSKSDEVNQGLLYSDGYVYSFIDLDEQT